MNRSIPLSVLFLPLFFACAQQSPEVEDAPLTSTSAPPSTASSADNANPSASSSPIFASPFISQKSPSSSPTLTPRRTAATDTVPDYNLPSPLVITRPQPPAIQLPQTPQIDIKTDSNKAQKVLRDNTIAPNGIGLAKVGMTIGELKQALGATAQFVIKEDFAPNYNAIAVTQQGQVQYYIPYPQETILSDENLIRFLITDNPNYKTSQGVGPGMTIKQASALAGAAKLSVSREANAQEIVKFANQPPTLVFRSQQSPGQDLAGIYPESNDDQIETDKYADQAKIRSIIVSCQDDICGAEH